MFIFASSQDQRPRLNEPTFLLSRPLRSTPPQRAGASQLLRAGPPASAATGTQCLRFLPRHAPSRPLEPAAPDDGFDARLLTFRARAADQAHAASTPGTTWPVSGHPPGSSRGYPPAPVLMPALPVTTRQRLRHTRLPDPRLTHPVRLFPHRSPRQSSAN